MTGVARWSGLLHGIGAGEAARRCLLRWIDVDWRYAEIDQLKPGCHQSSFPILLSGVATLANLAIIGGIIAVIVGIVLMVVDSGRQHHTPPSSSSPPPPYAGPSPPGPSATEEENRRLHEEVERLRREREGS